MKNKGLYRKMLAMAVFPVLLIGLIITIFCYFRLRNTLCDSYREEMQRTAGLLLQEYEECAPGDFRLVKTGSGTYDLYKGDADIMWEYSIVDQIAAATETEISLLYKDMRVFTTFKNEWGERITGTGINAATVETVLNAGTEAFYRDIRISNGEYLVLYEPITDSTGGVIGMVEVAREVSDLTTSLWRGIWPILVLAALGVGIAIWYTYRKTKLITNDLKKIQQFMNHVAEGNLQTDLDVSLFKRHDELSDIGRSAVSMQKSIRASVETDPLTGLYNRRYTVPAIERIVERRKDTGEIFSVVIGDIDFFKKVNDTYGHNAGDDVLKAVAAVLKKHMQGNGFAARWGGEEFLLVFDKKNLSATASETESILSEIRDMTICSEDQTIRVTMSFGVSEGEGENAQEIVNCADGRLYYAKQHGRNRIVSEDLPSNT